MTPPNETRTSLVWGVNQARTRQHLFRIFTDATWQRTDLPRSVCGTAWSAEMVPVGDVSVPRCNSCGHFEVTRSANATTGDPS